jgi:hypothetical protein
MGIHCLNLSGVVNVFQAAGFHHKKEMKAFKITGESANLIKQKLAERFGEIY